MSDSLTFGGWLHQQRHERGVTQDELAEYLGFSVSLLRKVEAGERRPSGQIAELLADYFDIPADEQAAFIAFARSGQAVTGTWAPAADAGPPLTPWRSGYRHQTNLPALLAPLIGREREGATAHDLLRHPKTRLLTLTGPPGIGKTRLGLYVAAGLMDHFADGVFFVDLAPVSDPAFVVPTVARTLGLKEADGRPVEQVLLAYAAGRRMLLLLDNFEQILDAAPAVVQLLEASPWLKVLVTSRAALHVRGERRFPVPPLGLPDPHHLPSVGGLPGYPAGALFVECAQAVDPAFALTEENAADVAAICIGLDGMPLAIELAAARTQDLALPALRHALSSHLQLLTGGARDLPARQQTMRGAIAWSYDLLADHEQRLFRALGVFVGGFTSDVLDGISADWPAAPLSALDTLLSLTDKYLVQEDRPTTPRGPVRFGLLEAMREYALEQLAKHGETAEIRRRHAAYYLALAEQTEPYLHGPQQARWLDRLESEHDNLRAALGWALEGEPQEQAQEIALRLAGALGRFWLIRGHLSEGRDWLVRALTQGTPSRAISPRAKALRGVGDLVWRQGSQAEATKLLREAVAVYKQLGDRVGMAHALASLGNARYNMGDNVSARALYERSLGLFRELGDQAGMGRALNNLGTLTHQEGDYKGARLLYEESQALSRTLGDRYGITVRLVNLGQVAHQEGDYGLAAGFFSEALEVAMQLGDIGHIAGGLEGLAGVAGATEQPQRAARLFGAAEVLRDVVGTRFQAFDRIMYDLCVTAARTRLDAAAWEQAWAEGRTMSVDEAVAYALK